MFAFAALLALQQTAAAAAATGPAYPGEGAPEVDVPRIEQTARIDGRLDEPAWSRAARLTQFWQYEPVDGRRAAEETEVLVWYAPDAIHFGVVARDRRPDRIRATVADRDAIDGDDRVVVYLDTFDDRRRAFFFAVNPLGVQQDGVRTEGAQNPGDPFAPPIDKNPDYQFDSEGRLTGDGYVVEVRIPFKSLRYPSADVQRWGIQVERRVQRSGHRYTWTDARRANASFLAQSGVLVGLSGLERGVVLETQPFVTATADGARDGAGEFVRADPDPDGGVNLRVGFSSVSLDATVNPDFSQVEADVGQVTVNERFALFFPEKRPFFLEGIELFGTPNQLVYTRRIVNPVAGAKLTGKVGAFGVAHLTTVDRFGPEGRGNALVNVTRLRRDFAESSVAGLTYTDHSLLEGDGANRVFAADVHHVFGGMYYAEAQLGGSWTDDGAATRSAPIAKFEVDRTGRRWGFNYSVNTIGSGFRADAGFVPRAGIVNAHAFNRFSFYGSEGALVEQVSVFAGPTRIWAYDDVSAGPIEGGELLGSITNLRGGWFIQTMARRDFFVLDPADYAHLSMAAVADAGAGSAARARARASTGGARRAGTAGRQTLSYRPLDEVSGPILNVEVNTPAYRRFDAALNGTYGRAAIFPEGSEGTVARLGGTLSLRPSGSLRVVASNAWERITRVRDGSRFARTIIPRLKVEVQPTRALFFRAIAEYRSERRAPLEDPRTGAPLLEDGEPVPARELDDLRIDLLASFEPSPGTVAFFGWGGSLDADGAFDFAPLRRRADGFFLKLAYRFRR